MERRRRRIAVSDWNYRISCEIFIFKERIVLELLWVGFIFICLGMLLFVILQCNLIIFLDNFSIMSQT